MCLKVCNIIFREQKSIKNVNDNTLSIFFDRFLNDFKLTTISVASLYIIKTSRHIFYIYKLLNSAHLN